MRLTGWQKAEVHPIPFRSEEPPPLSERALASEFWPRHRLASQQQTSLAWKVSHHQTIPLFIYGRHQHGGNEPCGHLCGTTSQPQPDGNVGAVDQTPDLYPQETDELNRRHLGMCDVLASVTACVGVRVQLAHGNETNVLAGCVLVLRPIEGPPPPQILADPKVRAADCGEDWSQPMIPGYT